VQGKTRIEELAERFRNSRTPLVSLSSKVPLWLKDALEERVVDLRRRGFQITKSAIVVEALMQFMDVPTPQNEGIDDGSR
jgi:predicted transcriptional regulator